MNVIVSNLNGNVFSNLNVDVIKSITGEFTAEEVVQSFSNFFFNRMFLDITAISNYSDVNNLKKLSMGLDVSKIILLLNNDTVVNSDGYISRLISMGIYNFAHNESELQYLYDNPNSYKDVVHLQKMEDISVPEVEAVSGSNGIRIIGFKNFTNHAGATSLIYMLKKLLVNNYYTVCIEVNKRDFLFYNDKDMISCSKADLNNTMLKYKDANIILLDLNDVDNSFAHSICTDVLYLMESSTLMVNKAVMLNPNCFASLRDKNVVLNKSLLSVKDIGQLQEEAELKFLEVIPPLNDRLKNEEELFPLLEKLGLYKKIS